MPSFLVPLVNLLLSILKGLFFWKSVAFGVVVLGLLTDAGKSIFMWVIGFLMGFMLQLISGFMPEIPTSVPELVNSLPASMGQLARIMNLPECLSILSSAFVFRLLIRVIPFVK